MSFDSFKILCNSDDHMVAGNHYWKNSDGEAAMPRLVPHGSDEDALYHHDCAQYSSFPALHMGPSFSLPVPAPLHRSPSERVLVYCTSLLSVTTMGLKGRRVT